MNWVSTEREEFDGRRLRMSDDPRFAGAFRLNRTVHNPKTTFSFYATRIAIYCIDNI